LKPPTKDGRMRPSQIGKLLFEAYKEVFGNE
jgi:hypothetical protein